MTTGRNLFLSRLSRSLKDFDLPDYNILNPADITKNIKKNNIIKIGRLDGVYYNKFSSTNLYNFIKLTKSLNLKSIKLLPDSFLNKLTPLLNNYLNRFNKQLINLSDALVFQSNWSLKMHKHFFGDIFNQKLHTVILNGVSTKEFYPHKDRLTLEGNPKIVITANFRPHKRLYDAINIINIVKKKHNSAKLHVIGTIDALTKSSISSLDTSNVVFHGQIDNKHLPKFYSACDLGLSLCLFDACPNSIVEMVACGLPVISTKESGASEIIKIDDLIISENVNLDFIELQTFERIPKLNINKWCSVIENILENKVFYSELMLKRVNEDLDIKIISRKYAEFIKKVRNA